MADAISKSDLETETRVSVLESQVDNIRTSVGRLEEKMDSNYATLHHRISDLRDDIRHDFDEKHEKLMNKLDERSKTSSDQHQVLFEKINSMEKWKWMVIGGAIILGYVIAHVKLDRLF